MIIQATWLGMAFSYFLWTLFRVLVLFDNLQYFQHLLSLLGKTRFLGNPPNVTLITIITCSSQGSQKVVIVVYPYL